MAYTSALTMGLEPTSPKLTTWSSTIEIRKQSWLLINAGPSQPPEGFLLFEAYPQSYLLPVKDSNLSLLVQSQMSCQLDEQAKEPHEGIEPSSPDY